MAKISIVYYSFTGNTYRMVQAFEKGLKEVEANYEITRVAEIENDELFESNLIVMASPANGAEELEKTYFQPFMEKNLQKFQGKKVYLFASYGWGGGKFVENWKKSLEAVGAEIVEKAILSNGSPNAEEKADLLEMGKTLGVQYGK